MFRFSATMKTKWNKKQKQNKEKTRNKKQKSKQTENHEAIKDVAPFH